MTELHSNQRIGAILPGVNTIIEQWYPTILPDGVSLHVNRLPSDGPPGVGRDAVASMDAHAVDAARTLADCRPDILLYGCTGSSFVGGMEYDRKLQTEIEEAMGIPTVTAANALLQALHHLDVGSIAVVTPYPANMGRDVANFLLDAGHEVKGEAHMGISDGFGLATPPPAEIIGAVHDAWKSANGRPQAVVIGCMNLGSHRAISQLEAVLAVPVVTATQSSLWAALRAIGRSAPIAGYGRLLAER